MNCPDCGTALHRKRAARCPGCGRSISDYVSDGRKREKRLEQFAALFSSALVLAFFTWVGLFALFEAVCVYVIAALAVWYWGRATFRS